MIILRDLWYQYHIVSFIDYSFFFINYTYTIDESYCQSIAKQQLLIFVTMLRFLFVEETLFSCLVEIQEKSIKMTETDSLTQQEYYTNNIRIY